MNIDLYTSLKKNMQSILQFLTEISSMAVILIDRNKNILDCNKGFCKILGLREKPINLSIENFLAPCNKEMPLNDLQLQIAELIFIGTGNIEVLLKGLILKLNGVFLLFLEQHKLSYNELIVKMTILNNQIVDISRKLEKKNIELKEALSTIKRIMNTDPLTGILNRRAFEKMLKKEISFAKRHNFPLSFTMMDIDHFKSINDTYGHEAGDYILKSLAKTVKNSIRQEDIFARFGGEEFVLLMPNTEIESAFIACERIRKSIERKRFKGIKKRITTSFGITQLIPTDNFKTLIKRADEALYKAKTKGRNRCEIG